LIGSADFFGGIASKRSSPFAVAAWSQWVGVPVVAVIAVVIGGEVIGKDAILGALAGLGSGIGVIMLYRGFSVGSVGIVAPVASTIAAILPIVIGLLGGERPPTLVAIGLIGGVVSVALVGYIPGTASISSTSVIHGVLAGVGFAAMVIAYSSTSEASGLTPAVTGRFASASIATLVMLVAGHTKEIDRSSWLPTFLAGALAGVGMGAYITASQQGELIIVGVAIALFPAVTVILAAAFINERLAASQWIGIALAVGAVAMISIG
jgi:drug/metabolite transporter (DMT)-like permease